MISKRSLNFDLNTLSGFAAILLWSTTIAVVRSLSEQVGSLTAAASVYLVGGFFCLILLFRRGSPARKIRDLSPSYLLGCGGLFVLYMLVLYLGIGRAGSRQQVLEVGLMNYLWPTLTLIFSLFILHKKASWNLLPGTGLALAGIFLVIGQEISISWSSFSGNFAANPIAYSLALIAAVSWALYSNLTRRLAGNGRGGVEFFIPVTGIIFLGLLFLYPENGLWTIQAAGEALYLGLVTVIAYLLWDRAMRKGDIVLVAAFSYLTPLFSTIVSCLYLGISAGVFLWVGCIMIIAGSVLSWISISKASTESSK